MTTFYLPDLGEGLAEAEIREWYVKEGDAVTVDQPLVSMETAKAVVDVPAPFDGVIDQLHGQVNDIIKTGAPLITFHSDDKASNKRSDGGSVVGSLESSNETLKEQSIVGAAHKASSSAKAMPAARVLAQEMGVDLGGVEASGPNGLITVADVKRAMETQSSQVVNKAKTSDPGLALHGARRMMAHTMAESHKQVVPVTLFEDADLTDFPTASDLSVHLVQAIVHAAKIEPSLNGWYYGDTLEKKPSTAVHLGLAVDAVEGLFVPVIKNAGDQNADALRARIDEFKSKAQKRAFTQEDLHGATITLSNFGTITGKYATPIIVCPQMAILGVGRLRNAPIVREKTLVPGRVLPLSLTFDHRAVTGGEATRFLGAVIDFLQGNL